MSCPLQHVSVACFLHPNALDIEGLGFHFTLKLHESRCVGNVNLHVGDRPTKQSLLIEGIVNSLLLRVLDHMQKIKNKK